MYHVYRTVTNSATGAVVSGATIYVYQAGTVSPAQLYSDNGVTTKAQPLVSAADGSYDFYVADGRYDIQISGNNIATKTLQDVEISDITSAAAGDSLWNCRALTATGAVTAVSFTGPLTGAVTGNVIGNLTGNVTGNTTGIFISGSANPALTGNIRLANADTFTIRNRGGAGSADLSILSTAGSIGNDTVNFAVDANISTVKIATSSTLQVGQITNYGGIPTVANGVPSEVARIDSLLNAAAITAATLYPVTISGLYRISWAAKVITAATTSSTLGGAGGFQVVYTDADDAVVVTPLAIPNAVATGNTTGTQLSGVVVVNAKFSTNIQYQFGYTSSGVTPMQYALHIRLEAI